MRRVNWGFAAILLAATALLLGSVYFVHGVQMRRMAPALLELARRAEADGDLRKAKETLDRYLLLRRDDKAAWAWYARIADRRDVYRRDRDRVFLIHAEALRFAPEDAALERRCAELAIELGRYGDAATHLENLLRRLGDNPPDLQASAELRERLADCQRELNRSERAEESYREAIADDPSRTSAYAGLARLLRSDRRRPEEGDEEIQRMVERNPKSAGAYLERWRYMREFAARGDPGDLARALELAPDDAEVRLAAAIAAEQGTDQAAARVHWERGWRVAPGHVALAVGLARLEAREGHLDRAEAVLRQAERVTPSAELTFELAEILILRDRIDGDGQARVAMARLDAAGFGETLVPFLEAEILVRHKRWREAADQLEQYRPAWRDSPRLAARAELMLADCHGRLGDEARRLEDLRRADSVDRPPELTRADLARTALAAGHVEGTFSLIASAAARDTRRRLDLIQRSIERTARSTADRRDWGAVEAQLRDARRALPDATVPLTVLEATLLAARGQPDQARSLLADAQANQPRELVFRLALARLAQRLGQGSAALEMIDRAEKDLGPNPAVLLARLDYWGLAGGDDAVAAVARIANAASSLPTADRAALLDRLAAVEAGLARTAQAREHLGQLAVLVLDDARILARQIGLAVQAGDHVAAAALVDKLRALEGDGGTLWRFGRASLLLDQARRGAASDLDTARALAARIDELRPEWWGGPILLAELAELAGRPDEAMTHYTRAIELGNNDPGVARRLAGLLDQDGDLRPLQRVARTLADRGASAADLDVAAALDAVRRRDFDRAITLARRAFPETSTHHADHLVLGQFYLAARRPDVAGRELRRAVDLAPGVPAVWVRYVQYLVRTGQIDQARAAVDAAARALPPIGADLAVARCAAIIGDTARATARIQAALDSPACDAATIRTVVDVLVDEGRFDRVEPLLDRLERPDMPPAPGMRAWANRARALARSSTGRPADLDRALEPVERNLAADPASPRDLQLKGLILARRPGRRAEAVRLLEPFDGSGQLAPRDRLVLAQAYRAEGDSDRYRRLIEGLVRAEPGDPRYLTELADFLVDRGELDEAGRRIDEAIRRDPATAGAFRLKRAAIHDRQGQYDAAEALFRDALREDPGNVEALNSLAWALALREPGRPREALVLVDRAIARGGRLPALVDTRAIALIRSGDCERALRELRDARAVDPTNVSLALHQAWAYQCAGQAERARRAFRLAEELGLRLEDRHPLERGVIERVRRELSRVPPPANQG